MVFITDACTFWTQGLHPKRTAAARRQKGLAAFLHPDELERRLVFLERAVAVLGGVAAASVAFAAYTRFRYARFHNVVVDRVIVAHPKGRQMAGRVVPCAELGVRNDRPELRLSNGCVALMDGKQHVRLQLDGSFWPAEPLRPPSREAIAGQSVLRSLQGKPALVFSSEGGVPTGYLGAESDGGVKRLRTTAAAGGSGQSGGGVGQSGAPAFGIGQPREVDTEALRRAVEEAPAED